ncbi:MAG: hypothetical protein ACXWVF_16785, partial [Telluria sp.]
PTAIMAVISRSKAAKAAPRRTPMFKSEILIPNPSVFLLQMFNGHVLLRYASAGKIQTHA